MNAERREQPEGEEWDRGARPVGSVVGLQRSPGGVPKLPVESAPVTPHGMMGDRQRDLRHHGGPDRALCLYSMDCIERLNAEGHPIRPGTAGENVTLRGLDWPTVTPGKRYRLGADAVIEITFYTTPCQNIAGSFREGDFSRILQKRHPGESRVYARVLREGVLSVGDPVYELGERAEE
jgi:MOSC domain-containing protein YiiM